MQSKTPQFDFAIEEILEKLKPGERECGMCGSEFLLAVEDIDFLRMFRVPSPKNCPDCRKRQRRAFANYTTFYKRLCNAPGHTEHIISQIPDNVPFPVYDCDYFFGDQWDPLRYALEYNADIPFFEQFQKLIKQVPQPQTTRDPMSIGSEYSSYGVQLKNCYYTFGGLFSENVLYSNWPAYTKDSVDVMIAWSSERQYENVSSKSCYACRFIYFSKQCLNSTFMYDCHNCDHCFGCVNLRNKKYCYFNEQLSKGEYEAKTNNIDIGSYVILTEFKKRFLDFLDATPKRSVFNERSVNSTGNFLENCRNYYDGFFAVDGENVRYAEMNLKAKDCMDMLLGTAASRAYFSVMPYEGTEIKFSALARGQCMAVEYSYNLRNCAYCFGCIGLTNKKFCFLNKQYTESGYWNLLDAIKTRMLKRGEYGNFLPMSFSPFPYNSTLADLSHPRTENQARTEGLLWVENLSQQGGVKVVTTEDVPDNISDVNNSDIEGAFRCERTGRFFRVTPQELEFYRRERIALPRLHPRERLLDRFKWMGFHGLKSSACIRCGTETPANLKISSSKNFICDKCYQKEFVM